MAGAGGMPPPRADSVAPGRNLRPPRPRRGRASMPPAPPSGRRTAPVRRRPAPGCRGDAAPSAPRRPAPAPRSGQGRAPRRGPQRPCTVARSCEMKTYERVPSAIRARNRSRICACTVTSRAEVGSSSTSTRGSTMSARASAARCAWPPDRRCGWSRRNSGPRPTRRSTRSMRSSTSGTASCALRIGSRTFCSTVIRGLSESTGS